MAERDVIMLEKVSQGGAWYEGQTYDIGARVSITDAAEQAQAGAASGAVVGYDPGGPRRGESFIRVLVQPDTATPAIVALPPTALSPEGHSERLGLARTILVGLEQRMQAARFRALLEWLAGPACAELLADPQIRRRRIRLGQIYLPGLVLSELADLAATRLK